MKISVIIPTYNRGYCIEHAVNSVLDQTVLPLEIIVVDDGSKDDTSEVLKKYSNRIIVIKQGNKGVSSARNTGIEISRGNWIALLDSDDEWKPDKLENHKKFYELNPELSIFQCEEIWIRNGIRVNPKKKHQKKGGWIFMECLPLCIISPSAVVFKKELWKEINGFDEQFPVCEDYDLWLRIARRYEIGLDKKPGTIKYGGHNDQLSRTFPIIDEQRIRALEKHIYDESLNPVIKKRVLKEAIKKAGILLNGAEKRNVQPDKWRSKLIEFKKLQANL